MVLGEGANGRMVVTPSSVRKVVEAWLAERRGGRTPAEALFTNPMGCRLSKKQIAWVGNLGGRSAIPRRSEP